MSSTWAVEEGKAVWDGRRLDEWSKVLVADIVAEFDPVAVWLYGSVARGDDDGDSDIDLLVVLDSFVPSDSIELKLQAFRAATTNAPFDVAFTDPPRYLERSRVAGTIERATVLDGRCMYQRD
ncbi:MAG: nucleotidyltransferase domain-containing protein [Ilumatobacteraceae bacterium]